MPALAELLGDDSRKRLEAARQLAEQKPEHAPAAPVQAATCQACGQRLPAPAAVFRSGAEQQAPRSGRAESGPQDAYARA